MEVEKLGPYRIVRKIGKGGMGWVFEATNELSGERAAVKALSPQLAASEGFRERFESEIDSLKMLQHDGIVRLFGWGEDAGTLFYSMELVEGASLEEEISGGRRFDWQETLDIAVQVCRALKHAHDHGVIHRDIKPANILITSDARVKIADFGIARLFGATQLTMAGGVLGTADYMSPEQADGGAVTDKCDQYCLGCVMFALLAGRPPFRANTMPEMLQMQRFAEPDPVRRYAPQTPEQLERLIQQLLSKDPSKRFPNALVLARHMEAMEKALVRKAERKAGEDNHKTVAPTTGFPDASDPKCDQTLDAGSVSMHPIETTDSDVHNAPTLADANKSAVSDKSEQSPAPTPTPALRPARFTTVADDVKRRSAVGSRERWSFVLQLIGLGAMLGALVYFGWTLTRPSTADELFARVDQVFSEEGVDGLGTVDHEMAEFLERFPNDVRVAHVSELRDELDLLRLEKQLRLKSRFNADYASSSIAHIYAAAAALEATAPARSQQMLEDLLALYEANWNSNAKLVETSETLDDQQQKWLTLAARKLIKLRETSEEREEELLPELQERLRAANRIELTDPHQALRMYEALVQLYGDQPWADPVVERARRRAESLAPRH